MTSAPWDPVVIRERLTPERLRSYLKDASQDLDQALRPYAWNMEVSGAVLTTSAVVEVVLRNRLDEQLTIWAARRPGRSWLDLVPPAGRGLEDIRKARSTASRGGRDVEVHGLGVAELSFGVWRYLVASRYLTSLWIPSLHAASPLGHADLRQRRSSVEAALQRLLYVRNRAAHHEPIHRCNLMADVNAADELLDWTRQDSRFWWRRLTRSRRSSPGSRSALPRCVTVPRAA